MNHATNLSTDQIRSLANGDPIPVMEAGLECVLIRADIYDQLKEIVGDEWTTDELRALAQRTFDDADTAGPIP